MDTDFEKTESLFTILTLILFTVAVGDAPDSERGVIAIITAYTSTMVAFVFEVLKIWLQNRYTSLLI